MWMEPFSFVYSPVTSTTSSQSLGIGCLPRCQNMAKSLSLCHTRRSGYELFRLLHGVDIMMLYTRIKEHNPSMGGKIS
jgi:hypothetical protein